MDVVSANFLFLFLLSDILFCIFEKHIIFFLCKITRFLSTKDCSRDFILSDAVKNERGQPQNVLLYRRKSDYESLLFCKGLS